VTIWEIFAEEEPYGTEPPYLASAGVIYKGLRPDLTKLPESIKEDLVPLLKGCWRVCSEVRSSMEDVLKQLIAVQQNYLPSQHGIHPLWTPASRSSSVRSVHNTIYGIPNVNSPSDYCDHQNSNLCCSRQSRKNQRRILKPWRTVVHPYKNQQKNHSQYSSHASKRNSSEYPQYQDPTKKLVQSSRRAPKIATPQRVISQRRQNALVGNYSVSCPYPQTISSNIIRPRTTSSTQSCRKLNIPSTPYGTSREYPLKSHPVLREEIKTVFRNIDSDSSDDFHTLKSKNDSDTTTIRPEVKTETITISIIEPNSAEFNKTVPYKFSTVKVDEHFVDFRSNLTPVGKNTSTATFK
jgi:hypothetical protein